MKLGRIDGYNIDDDCYFSEIQYTQNDDSNTVADYSAPFCSVKFYDEKLPQECKIEFLSNVNADPFEDVDFYDFLKMLNEIKEEFAKIKKNQEKEG